MKSLAGKITVTKHREEKERESGSSEGGLTAPGDSTTGRGGAEQEQVHLVGTAFCSFLFRCQIVLQQTEQNTTPSAWLPLVIISVRN